jgi:arsenate reductase
VQEIKEKTRVLFLCTGNSCRSQMAEGWARHLRGQSVQPYSAGLVKHGLNPIAVQVMAEAGVDITRQWSKTTDELGGLAFDLVVTVCDHAAGACPVFPAKTRVIHAPFDDPPRLAAGLGDEAARLAVYRRVRDEIRAFVESLPGALVRD